MKPLNKLQTFLLNAGGILLLVGAILPAIGALQTVAPYVFTLGAALFGSMQAAARYTGNDITVKRLRRQQMLGATALMAAGVLMFTSLYQIAPFNGSEWQLLLAIGAVLEVYTAFRIPAALKKSDQSDQPRRQM